MDDEGTTSQSLSEPKLEFQKNETPLEECCCQRIVRVSVSTQTDTLADPLKIQHDHSYVKPVMTNMPRSRPGTSKCQEKFTSSNTTETTSAMDLECEHIDTSDEDTDIESEVDDDVSYVPSISGSSSTDDCDSEDNPRDTVFLVYKSAIDQLFEKCSECGSILELNILYRGTMVVYEWICHNNHRGRWASQPFVRGMPQGNLDLPAAILFAGGTYRKIFDIAKTMNLRIVTETHFFNVQKSYLFPVIGALYDEQHEMWLDAFRYQHVFLSGDGRSDSPGHNAKYLAYTLMEEDSGLILHSELVQVTEAPGQAATNMERLAFNRALSYLLDEDVLVDGVSTDRHPQIGCDMDNEYPELKHEFDIFHVAKNINKKIREKASKRDCKELRGWIPCINLHLWWCCASCNGDYVELKDKWISILHHICNIHEWASGDAFHKCSHDPLSLEDVREIAWLKPGTPPYKELQNIVLNKKLLKDMKKMSLFKHTGSLEVYHGMLLKYCPKREHFSYEGMRARLQLAIMDNNENVGRQQATTDDGTLRFGLSFPKRKKQWVVSKVYTEKTFNFRERLMEMVWSRRRDKDIVLGERYVGKPDLPKNIACTERPNKQDAIDAYRTRFQLQ